MTHDEPTVAVLGPGGVGGLLAALLARAGKVSCGLGAPGAQTAGFLGTRGASRSARRPSCP
jgi:2-dehydropantoate 2-reductase